MMFVIERVRVCLILVRRVLRFRDLKKFCIK